MTYDADGRLAEGRVRTVRDLLAALDGVPPNAEVKGYYDSAFGTGAVWVGVEPDGAFYVDVE